ARCVSPGACFSPLWLNQFCTPHYYHDPDAAVYDRLLLLYAYHLFATGCRSHTGSARFRPVPATLLWPASWPLRPGYAVARRTADVPCSAAHATSRANLDQMDARSRHRAGRRTVHLEHYSPTAIRFCGGACARRRSLPPPSNCAFHVPPGPAHAERLYHR